MLAGVELPGSEKPAGILLEIPATDVVLNSSPSPRRMPRRLRKRLLECKGTSPTVSEIEAKLRDASLRRQKFHEDLSSKARRNIRSPSSSSRGEDLGRRLEEKLIAAEQKRLGILSELQSRLARLDKLRQVAKNGVEMHFEKKREKLGSEVETRLLQAKANRLQILYTCGQRRASIRERRTQSLLRRMIWENKYKERVRAAIYQKRVSAERNRLKLLETDKKRAQARFLEVCRVANSVNHHREVQSRRIKDRLEDRLQRAIRQRTEFLSKKGRLHGSTHGMWMQPDLLSRKIARCWKRFRELKNTTFGLAKAHVAMKINEITIKSMTFELLARLIESNETIHTVDCLLNRFESRFLLLNSVTATLSVSNIDHLLKSVASPSSKRSRQLNPTHAERSPPYPNLNRVTEKRVSNKGINLSRYQVRVVLCAYMILGHQDAVFSEQGECELSLAKSAVDFVHEFELLVKIILDGPVRTSGIDRSCTFRSQLAVFDRAWCTYLNCFVLWKAKDAKALEEDLVRTACQLELSMMQTCKITPEGDSACLTDDLKAIQNQVAADQKLLRDKVRHLSGEVGIEHMEHALSDTRTNFFQAKSKENRSPHSFLDGVPSYRSSYKHEGSGRFSNVVRFLFQDGPSHSNRGDSFDSTSSLDKGVSSSREHLVLENELIVNEVVHDHDLILAETFKIPSKDQNNIEGNIRETMERAFWDGIMESMEQDEPNYDRVIALVREVKDELLEIAPQSWKQEINDSIDLDILSQVLKSSNLDMNYLGNILDFALVTLRKLSAPATDDQLKATHKKLQIELTEICQSGDNSNSLHVIALVKGLRSVLEQIQGLKKEICRAHIKMAEPVLKGPTGLDYLKTCFANRYGPPSNARITLPTTLAWISSVLNTTDLEWSEHNAILERIHTSDSKFLLPSGTLKTGMDHPLQSNEKAPSDMGKEQVECKGDDKVDLVVRLGLLKLVNNVSGLTEANLPETLKLNLSRLRRVQAQVQKVILISTCLLIYQQTLASSQILSTERANRETMVSKCASKLWGHLPPAGGDAGIKEIVEIMDGFFSEDDGTRKSVMEGMMVRSLRDGDAVFASVSRAVYSAMRGVVLAGNGKAGRVLSETALRKVGVVDLAPRVVEAGGLAMKVAMVSVRVHGQWYAELI